MKVLYVLAIFGLAAAGAMADGNANKFVDQVIAALTKQKNIDPFHIPDHTFHVDRHLGAIHIKGDVDLKNGVINGLGHVARNGDATIGNKNGTFEARLRLGDKNVKFHADVKTHFSKIIHPNLKIQSDIGDIDVKLALAVGANGTFQLEEFEIDEFKHVRIHVHGLSLLDPLVDLIADGFVAFFNPNARRLLTNVIRPVVEEELKNFHPTY